MKRLPFIWLFLFTGKLFAQQTQSLLYQGNQAYRNKAYDKAGQAYAEALRQSPNDLTARFNLGNALYRSNHQDKALEQFEAIAQAEGNLGWRAKAFYNKGVILGQQKKLDESITAYKNALKLDPADSLARENLQRALRERKQKQDSQSTPPPSQKPPQQRKDKLDQKKVMQLLNALQEQEKLLRQRMNKSQQPSPNRPEKDW